MPVICVTFAYLVVMGQGLVFPDESPGLREFYWISVFFVLTPPLLHSRPWGWTITTSSWWPVLAAR